MNNQPADYPSINLMKALSRVEGQLQYLSKYHDNVHDLKTLASESLQDIKRARESLDQMIQDHRSDIKQMTFKEIYNKSPFQVN